MKLYIARHGRTNYNDLGLCNADPTVDVHLTPEGIEQAKALADKLKQLSFDHIFVSELKRTQQTADIVNRFHNLSIEIDSRLNDGRSGFEGKPFSEYSKAFEAAPNKWTARFNDGESVEDIKERVADFLSELRTRPYQAVLIITSQWIIQALLVVLRQVSDNSEAWDIEVPQGSYIELDI